MVGLLLTVAFALQAQVKIAPMMQKGTVKNYVAVAIATLPGQGDVKITTDTKYTITELNVDPAFRVSYSGKVGTIFGACL